MEAALCFGRDVVRVFRKSDDTAWVLRSAGFNNYYCCKESNSSICLEMSQG
jgi:hypothetical protein